MLSQNKTEYFILSKVAEVSTFTSINSLVAETLMCSRNIFSGKTLLPCGNYFYVSVRLRPKALCCRVVRPSVRPSVRILTNIYLKFFFAFNAVASLDNISLRAGRWWGGGGGQGQLDSFCQEAGGGIKTILNKKVGGSRIFFLSNARVSQEGH